MKPKKPDTKNPKITPMPASAPAAEPPKPIILQPGTLPWERVTEAARLQGREPSAFCLVAGVEAIMAHDRAALAALNGKEDKPSPGQNPFACHDPGLESKVSEIVAGFGITPGDFARACIHRGLRELKEKGAVTFGAPHAQQEKEVETVEAFNRFALGWGPHDPPPTVDDLLEPDLKQKMLEIWLATGTNVIATAAVEIVLEFAECLPDAIKRVRESQESELYSVLLELSEKWKGGPEA